MLVTLRLSLGQLNLIKEDYSAAEEHLRELLLLADQDTASNRVLLAAALIGQERYEDALKPLRTAIDEKRTEGEVPPENWLSMLSSVYFELDDYPAMPDQSRRAARTARRYRSPTGADRVPPRQGAAAPVHAPADDREPVPR